jgi:hypothetical protein
MIGLEGPVVETASCPPAHGLMRAREPGHYDRKHPDKVVVTGTIGDGRVAQRQCSRRPADEVAAAADPETGEIIRAS